MENQQYFAVLQSTDDAAASPAEPGAAPPGRRGGAGAPTIYPEVHYVFADDAFSPEMDAVERAPGDISVMVDLDETGREIRGCQSISPEWQVTDALLIPQALDTASASSATQQNSMLLKIQGIHARQNQDFASFQGDFAAQVATGLALINQLESRQRELQRAVSSFPEGADSDER